MEEIFSVDHMHNLKFIDNKFRGASKEDGKLKSVGELIADYVTSSVKNFNSEYKNIQKDREFTFVSDNYSPLDSFLEAKNKINIFIEDRLDLDRLNFAIDFLKYIKHIETELVLNMKVNAQGHFISDYDYDYVSGYDYKFKGFYLEFKLYPDSWLKSFEFGYDGRKLIKVSEYIEFGVKVIEYVYDNLSIFDTRMKGNEYSDAVEWLLEVKRHVNRYPF